MKHYATASWNGSGLEGEGVVSVKSCIIEAERYSFGSRFKNDLGTNPEELMAAAHATDFTMKLSFVLTEAGFVPDSLRTTCFIQFEKGQITGSHLLLQAKIPNMEPGMLERYILEANNDCPITRALKINTRVESRLDQ
jgi:lipoyl-dependent peroxiredoxin